MQIIPTVEAFYQLYDQIKREIPGWTTNFYPTPARIAELVEQSSLQYIRVGTTSFFLQQRPSFQSVFYCTAAPEHLQAGLQALHSQISGCLVIDVLVSLLEDTSLLTALENSGYRHYASFRRMHIAQQNVPGQPVHSPIRCATPQQADSILALLEQSFDPLIEHLPTLKEIVDACEKQTILITEEDEQITGLLFYQQTRLSSELRYWLVKEAWRDRNIGSALLHTYWQRSAHAQNHYLWVNTANQNAIQRYLHFGYTFDTLSDLIYIHLEEK